MAVHERLKEYHNHTPMIKNPRRSLQPLDPAILEKISPNKGIKPIITPTFNFKEIDTPFGVHDMTLENIKRKKLEDWKIKKAV